MMRSHRLAPPPRAAMAPPPPLELIDDAIAEILLRLPPDDPASLVRASLVCKLWHRVLSEPTFLGRYREFHGTPPLLGFLSGSYTCGYDMSGRFFPIAATRRIPFHLPVFGCRALDCRHGRVLLDTVDGTGTIRECLVVWDPVTGDHKVLGDPAGPADTFGCSGVVLCAAAGCDHRGCHGGGPFQVVFVSTLSSSYDDDEGTNNAARAWVYSSETDAWSTPAYVQIHFDGYRAAVERSRAAIVGDQIYFLLNPGAGIVKYDLEKQCLIVVGSPYAYIQHGILMTMEDGSLGLVGIKDDESTTLYMWRVTKGNPNGSMGWVQDRVFLLDKLLDPIIQTTEDTYSQVIRVVGFAEGVDILLLGECEDGRGFMFELKSGRIRELSKPDEYYYYCYDVFFPYTT